MRMNLSSYLKNESQTALAKRLGVSQGMIWQWANERSRITAERAIQIEIATDGKVTVEEMRPDVDWAYLRASGRLLPESTPEDLSPNPPTAVAVAAAADRPQRD